MGMRVVIFQPEILITKGKEVRYLRVEVHLGQGSQFAAQLQPDLLHMVIVYVGIPEGVDKIPRFQPANLGHH